MRSYAYVLHKCELIPHYDHTKKKNYVTLFIDLTMHETGRVKHFSHINSKFILLIKLLQAAINNISKHCLYVVHIYICAMESPM